MRLKTKVKRVVSKRIFGIFGVLLIGITTLLAPIQMGMIAGENGQLAQVEVKVSMVEAANTTYVFCHGQSTRLLGKYILGDSSSCPTYNNSIYSGWYVTCSAGSPPGQGVFGTGIFSTYSNAPWDTTGCTVVADSSSYPANEAAATAQAERRDGKDTSCNSFATCVADLVYIVTVGPTAIFAYIGSLFMSVGIKLSLTSTAYALDFLTKGWTVARDVANMAFLFIIIFLAFSIILRADTSGTTQTLALIIVMALLVNFSFFLTRVVIDAGNIAAVQVYNAIPITTMVSDLKGKDGTPLCNTSTTASTVGGANFICGMGMKDLSESIMAGLNLQNLYTTEGFKSWAAREGRMTQLLTLVALYIATAILLAILGFMFLAAGAKFLTRIVALWFLIIAAPLAFAAFALPQTKQYFNKWRSLLLTNTFYPAVFLFMFLLVTIFMQQGCGQAASGQCLGILGNIFNSANTAPGGPTPNVQFAQGLGINLTAVAIVMGLVIIMIYMAMKVADKVSVSGANLTAKLPGWVAGKYAGSIGWAGRKTLGRAGEVAYRSQGLRDYAERSRFGNLLWRGAGAAGRGSFDFRAAPGAGVMQKAGIGAAGGKGGYRDAAKRRADKLFEREKDRMGDTEAEKELLRKQFEEKFKTDDTILKDISGNKKTAEQTELELKGKEKYYNDLKEKIANDIEPHRLRFEDLDAKRRLGTLTDPAEKAELEHERGELARLREEQRQYTYEATQAGKNVQMIEKEREKFIEAPGQRRLARNIKSLEENEWDISLGSQEGIGRLRKLLKPQPTPYTPDLAVIPPTVGEGGGGGEADDTPNDDTPDDVMAAIVGGRGRPPTSATATATPEPVLPGGGSVGAGAGAAATAPLAPEALERTAYETAAEEMHAASADARAGAAIDRALNEHIVDLNKSLNDLIAHLERQVAAIPASAGDQARGKPVIDANINAERTNINQALSDLASAKNNFTPELKELLGKPGTAIDKDQFKQFTKDHGEVVRKALEKSEERVKLKQTTATLALASNESDLAAGTRTQEEAAVARQQLTRELEEHRTTLETLDHAKKLVGPPQRDTAAPTGRPATPPHIAAQQDRAAAGNKVEQATSTAAHNAAERQSAPDARPTVYAEPSSQPASRSSSEAGTPILDNMVSHTGQALQSTHQAPSVIPSLTNSGITPPIPGGPSSHPPAAPYQENIQHIQNLQTASAIRRGLGTRGSNTGIKENKTPDNPAGGSTSLKTSPSDH